MIIVIAVLLLIIVLSNPIAAKLLGIVVAAVFVIGACLLTFAAIAFVASLVFALANG